MGSDDAAVVLDVDGTLVDSAYHPRLAVPLRTQVRPIAGALEFVRLLVEAGHVVVVASSRERELVDEALDLVGITNVVRDVVSGDEVSDPKPAPDLVVAALRTVGASHGVLFVTPFTT